MVAVMGNGYLPQTTTCLWRPLYPRFPNIVVSQRLRVSKIVPGIKNESLTGRFFI